MSSINVKLVIELLDSPISFNRAFYRISGDSLTAGMLLSQLFYWAKTKNFIEEFYKTNDELQEECCLGRTEFENARKKLVSLGLITFIKKGLPCKSYYTVNLDKILDLLNNTNDTKPANTTACEPQTSMLETCKLDSGKPANTTACEQHSIINNREYTENTTEIIPPNPLGGENVNVTIPILQTMPTRQRSMSDEMRDLAYQAWLNLIGENNLSFTEFELSAIKAYAYSKPNMPPHIIQSNLSLLEKWSLEGLDIENSLRQSLSTRTLVEPKLRKKHDAKGNRIYDVEHLNWLREQEIKRERGAA